MYDICLRTADAGDDGTHLYTDPRLPGHVWAGAYVALEPEHGFVVDDGDRVVGYILGALDSRTFEAQLDGCWWPALRAQYPLDDTATSPGDRIARSLIHHPPRADESLVGEFPSHLHIDLLPSRKGAATVGDWSTACSTRSAPTDRPASSWACRRGTGGRSVLPRLGRGVGRRRLRPGVGDCAATARPGAVRCSASAVAVQCGRRRRRGTPARCAGGALDQPLSLSAALAGRSSRWAVARTAWARLADGSDRIVAAERARPDLQRAGGEAEPQRRAVSATCAETPAGELTVQHLVPAELAGQHVGRDPAT